MLPLPPLRAPAIFGKLVPLLKFSNFLFEIHSGRIISEYLRSLIDWHTTVEERPF
jgi:hypothetical protein